METRWVFIILRLFLLAVAILAADKTLFDENDKVVIYKEDTVKEGLYNGARANIFLLYSSWCGHCQRFAPTYKEFADAIAAWSYAVTVSGVDCVYDTPVCRKYNVRGYPTVRFIGPTTNESDIGITYDGDRTIKAITGWTIDMLSEVKNPPPTLPNLKAVTEAEAQNFTTSTNRPRIVVVVNDERTGREILLDMGADANLRFVIDTTPAAVILGAKTPGLVLFSADGKVSHVSNLEPTVGDMEKTIKHILYGGEEKDGGEDSDNNKDQQDGIDYVDTSQQYKLFELDLQSAINTAFYTEVSLKTEFTEKEFYDLKKFVSVAHRCGSWTLEYKKQLSQVKRLLNDVSTMTGKEWSGILDSASQDSGFPRNSTFVGCKGSQPTSRGYSCSLWVLFHTMLSSCYNTSPGSVEVLRAIHGYVDSFFTCSYCRRHFLAMAERMRLMEITDEQTAVLSFWEAHNQVNERLSDTLHDPYFPKVQYPPPSLCAECSAAGGQFDTSHVFGFLIRHYRRVLTPYGKLRLVEEGTFVLNRAVRYQPRSNVILEAHRPAAPPDILFYVFVCAVCAAILISCLLFLSRRKLKLMNFLFVS